jgi:hypothetical protein
MSQVNILSTVFEASQLCDISIPRSHFVLTYFTCIFPIKIEKFSPIVTFRPFVTSCPFHNISFLRQTFLTCDILSIGLCVSIRKTEVRKSMDLYAICPNST